MRGKSKIGGLYRILHIFLSIVILAHTVIPAKAGIQGPLIPANMLVPGNLISRFRGKDKDSFGGWVKFDIIPQ